MIKKNQILTCGKRCFIGGGYRIFHSVAILLVCIGSDISAHAQTRPSLDKLRNTLLDATVNPGYVMLARHRAAWTHGTPENSRAAVDTALKDPQIDIIEVDVKLSKDGKAYLLHDNYLQRSTNFLDVFTGKVGTGTDSYGKCDQYTWSELSNLRLKNEERTYTDLKIPLLDEIIDAVRGKNVILQIDMDNNKVTMDSCITLAKRKDALSFVMFKGHITIKEFLPMFNKLNEDQKKQIIFVPYVRMDSKPDGASAPDPMGFYKQWKDWSTANPIYKGVPGLYETVFKTPADTPVIKVAAQARSDKKRLGMFAAQPEYYRGRYKGNINKDQCCLDIAKDDRRGDWDFILAPNGNSNAGINGYILTDEETAFLEFFPARSIK